MSKQQEAHVSTPVAAPNGSRSPGSARATTGFRPDVEGLRAVAVLLVVADHVLGGPAGGYIGVDVFFVISGFLITGLLLREHRRTGRIDVREFYARRARRLLPAAVLVLAVTNVLTWLAFTGERAGQALRDSLYAVGFAANVRFADLGTSYFDQTRPASPVQHYWSLAVEEQCYLVWPLLLFGLLALTRRRPRPLLAAVGALCALSLVWSLVFTGTEPAAAYFSTLARAWELGLGAVLAIVLHLGLVRRLPVRVATATVWTGLAVIALAAVLYDAATPFPGLSAALPVAGALLVLLGGRSASPNPVLVNPFSSYVGRLSYSLYLWHWPVLILLEALMDPGVLRTLLVLALSFALAALSHHLVESPVRRSGWLSRRPAGADDEDGDEAPAVPAPRRARRTAVALTAITALSLGGWVLPAVALTTNQPQAAPPTPPETLQQLQSAVRSSIAPASWPPLEVPLSRIADATAPEWTVDGCETVTPDEVDRCVYGSPLAAKRLAIVGDSLATSLLPGLRAELEPRGWKIYSLTFAQCPNPVLPFLRNGEPWPECDEHKAFVRREIAQIKPQMILMSHSLTYLQNQVGDPQGQARLDGWQEGMAKAVRSMSAPDRDVYVVGPPPRAGNLQTCVTRVSVPEDCTRDLPQDWLDLRTAEAAAAQSEGATYVDVETWFCASGRCPSVVGATPVYTDDRHLTAAYARRLGPHLRAVLGVD